MNLETVQKNLIAKATDDGIDADMAQSLALYVTHGISGGGFLTAVLENDLIGALGRADHRNINRLPEYGKVLYNHIPSSCWGSREKVEEWIGHQGLKGV